MRSCGYGDDGDQPCIFHIWLEDYSLYAFKHHAGNASAKTMTDERQQTQFAMQATLKTYVRHLGEFDEWTTHDGGSTIAFKRQSPSTACEGKLFGAG